MNHPGKMLGQLMTLIRGERQAVEPPVPAVVEQRVSDEELRERANRGRLLQSLPNDKAFQEFRFIVLRAADKEKNALIDLGDDALMGTEGVAKKHYIRGMIFAVAQVAIAVKAGMEAEAELAKRNAPKPELTQVTRIG